jgi:hypothetical protein
MANPFPGMNPYLEDRALWNDFHARMAVYISNQLQPQLRPRYVASVEERVYLEFVRREIIPDVLILRRKPADHDKGVAVLEPDCDAPVVLRLVETPRTEHAVHIYDREDEMRLVTVIEILSPSNKDPRSEGRNSLPAQAARNPAQRK